MDVLHEPLVPILKYVLATAGLPRNGTILDLASGCGLKLPLLRDACGPDVTLLALDRDYSAIADCRLQIADCTTEDERMPSLHHPPLPRPPGHSFTLSPLHLLTADAHALPLVDGCCAAACCIAAWSLFTNPTAVLHELRRVVAPGGPILIVSGTQAWAHVTRWPPALAEQLQAALARAHAGGMPWPSAPDVGDELTAQFAAAGMPVPRIRAFLLDLPDPARAALALLPWRQIRAVVAPFLQDSTLRAADHVAMTGEVELCTLALAAQATRPREDFITQRQLRAC